MTELPQYAPYESYSLQELEEQYDIEGSVPDRLAYLKKFEQLSAQTRKARTALLDIQYGLAEAERLDVFLSDGAAPSAVVVMIHGGGWRASSKEARAFPAELYCPQGAIFVSLEYPLAPDHPLDRIVDSVQRGVKYIGDHAAEWGGDPQKIVLVGNSAGGHLAAMAANAHCAAQASHARIAGLVTISGVFDMEPLRRTAANSWLNMDAAIALRNSPMRTIPSVPCPTTVLVGAEEPEEFRRQSFCYAAALQNAGADARFVEVSGENHFSIIERIGEPGNPVSDAVFGYFKPKLSV